jgi:hypothetical protein
MKFLQWLGKAGKASVATLAGLGGVAAVAGVASWVYLSGDNPDNTSFNLGGNPSSNIVYSVGGNADYSAGSQEGGSDLLVSSRNIQILDEQSLRETEAEEMAQSHKTAAQAFATSGGDALLGNSGYQGDKIGKYSGSVEDPTASLAGLSDVIAKAQGGMGGVNMQGGPNGGAAANGEAEKEGGKPALASSQRPDWGSSAALSGKGGNGVNNQFVTQANGLGRSASGASGNVAEQVAGALQAGEAGASGVLKSVLPNGRGSFGNANKLEQNVGSTGGRGGFDRNKAINRLRFAQKRSTEEAKNKHRMAVTTAFMGGDRRTGGITLEDGSLTTGQGQGSQDLSGDFKSGLKNLSGFHADMTNEDLKRQEDASQLKSRLWATIGVAIAAMIAIPLLRCIPIFGWALAAAVACAALATIASLFVKAAQYGNDWGSSGLTTVCYILGSVLAGGVAASFFFPGVFLKVIGKVATFLGLGGVKVVTAAAVMGLAATAGAASQIASKSAWKNERDN